jgi:hypothetical protein
MFASSYKVIPLPLSQDDFTDLAVIQVAEPLFWGPSDLEISYLILPE